MSILSRAFCPEKCDSDVLKLYRPKILWLLTFMMGRKGQGWGNGHSSFPAAMGCWALDADSLIWPVLRSCPASHGYLASPSR